MALVRSRSSHLLCIASSVAQRLWQGVRLLPGRQLGLAPEVSDNHRESQSGQGAHRFDPRQAPLRGRASLDELIELGKLLGAEARHHGLFLLHWEHSLSFVALT